MKTKFFFDFVYGPKFDISYESVKTNIPEKELAELEEKEEKSKDVVVKMYKENNIEPGEDSKVMEIARPFYEKHE